MDNADLQVAIASIIYYLYRSAGCPYGDNPSGMSAWWEIQVSEFEVFSEQHCSEK